MSKRSRKPLQPKPTPKQRLEEVQPLTIVNPHAAAIDVHSDTHWVCVGPEQYRPFRAYTADLEAIADYLHDSGVTTVVMEATGVYWVPLFELLEARGFQVFLVEPGQLSSCGARPKSDRLDCQWMQRLHTYGLLKGSFRPPESILALRSYHRQRQMLICHAAEHVQHMQKALEQMNVKLTEVLSDITGLTGLAIIRAILAGERDPQKLAQLRDSHCHKKEAEIAQALVGVWRAEHLFELQQAYELFKAYQLQITACDRRIETELAKLPPRCGDKPMPDTSGRRKSRKNELRFEACVPLFKALGVDLTAIDGIDVNTALVVLAEIGVDVSRFPTEKHFASWLGVCPRTARSNKTEKKKKPRKGKQRVKQALRMAAQAVGRTMTPLGVFYRRIKGRIGGAGACTATAHKMARLIYRMLK
jgi:transposase